MSKDKWALVNVYGGDDGFAPLCHVVETFEDPEAAKQAALDLAKDIYNDWCAEFLDKGETLAFDDFWERVDNSVNEDFLDWGFDPVNDYVNDRLRVVRYEEKGNTTLCALATPPRKGKWKNGTEYEYEYAYCSECGRMQWAGWDSHRQAKENIGSFSNDYKFCPGCGAEMEGGEYVK